MAEPDYAKVVSGVGILPTIPTAEAAIPRWMCERLNMDNGPAIIRGRRYVIAIQKCPLPGPSPNGSGFLSVLKNEGEGKFRLIRVLGDGVGGEGTA